MYEGKKIWQGAEGSQWLDKLSVDSLDSLEFSCAPAEPFSGFGVPTQRMMTVGKR